MIGPWSYQSSYFTPPATRDLPDCPNCGGVEALRTDGGRMTGTYCPRCEKRREMHRDRGRQLRQRVARLGRDRSAEAARMKATRRRQLARLGALVDDLPF